ncbi:unnamed protein product [Kuraishia capsulata CBS 1993]|uniref:Uncharacterized protein n=1 Tax=Kuraishia capsulata CBS 1993 TaxID=1382522 RepID=W6MX07_9ASCO|nr:uncharacterized protein KUCA_T00004046001 [Kuraishia capsulata CBS 1993]CDK28065.1 unnamed protein product [Kuraishia capsulata CBS 1993]
MVLRSDDWNQESPSDFCQELKLFIKIIYVLTGSCAIDMDRSSLIAALKPVSQVAGYLSIIAWLFAQLPQVIKNYRDKSVEGLSLAFLGCWFMGDLLNFTSCLMSNALPFQTLLSGYYIIIDGVLAGQYYYYSRVYEKSKDHSRRLKRSQRMKDVRSPKTALRERLTTRQPRQSAAPNSDNVNITPSAVPIEHIPADIPAAAGGQMNVNPSSFGKLISSSFILGFSKANGLPIPTQSEPTRQSAFDQIISFFFHLLGNMDRQGVAKLLAWACTFLYLSSRIPQIITNHKLHSTRGISINLFMAAISGNLLYSISLCTSEGALVGGEVSNQFWTQELSYLAGSIGTVIFDLIVLFQWYSWDYGRQVNHGSRSGKLVTSPSPIAGKRAPIMIHKKMSSKVQNKIAMSIASSSTLDCKPIVILSPKHARKLSELTPLSPIDFLIEDLMGPRNKASVPIAADNLSSLKNQTTHKAMKKWAESATVIIGDDDDDIQFGSSADENAHINHFSRQKNHQTQHHGDSPLLSLHTNRGSYGSFAYHDHLE